MHSCVTSKNVKWYVSLNLAHPVDSHLSTDL